MPFWKRKAQEIRVPKVRFLGEQDGPSERTLKDKLTEFFRDENSVAKAYLVRADLGDEQGISVVLALVAEPRFEPHLVRGVGAIFGTQFNSKAHLDVMFLSQGQQSELEESCQAFFVA